MSIVPNHLKNKLAAGGVAASLNLVHWRTANAAGVAQAAGFDWLFIDLEHNSMSVDTVAQLCVAALPTTVTPIVRVPAHDSNLAARVLDAGAMGVVVPHVDSAAQAAQVVRQCRFPPVGQRSLTGPLPQLGFAALPTREAVEILNAGTLVIVMLETAGAIAAVDAIAAVPGVDGIMIGSNDLAADLGIPGEFGHERIEQAYAALIAACARHGKFPGMGGIYDHALMARYIGMGVRLLLGGGDLALLLAAAKARTSFLRGLAPAQPRSTPG